MARQNLRLMALAFCTLRVLAGDGEAPPWQRARADTTGLGKPRPGSSDATEDLDGVAWPDHILALQAAAAELDPPRYRADGEARREGIVTEVQQRRNGAVEVAIMVRYRHTWEIKSIHCRDWQFAEYFQIYNEVDRSPLPIKGDVVKFTVADASLSTSRCGADGKIIPKHGRVNAVNVVKIGFLSQEERKETTGYNMSKALRSKNDLGLEWGPTRDAASVYGSSKRSNSKGRGCPSICEDASTAGDGLDWSRSTWGQVARDNTSEASLTTSAGSSPHVPEREPTDEEWMIARRKAEPLQQPTRRNSAPSVIEPEWRRAARLEQETPAWRRDLSGLQTEGGRRRRATQTCRW